MDVANAPQRTQGSGYVQDSDYISKVLPEIPPLIVCPLLMSLDRLEWFCYQLCRFHLPVCIVHQKFSNHSESYTSTYNTGGKRLCAPGYFERRRQVHQSPDFEPFREGPTD